MISDAEERLASYEQTLDYLYAHLPMFSRIGAAAIKKDLTNTLALCAGLGNPQDRFKSIHIAGTNGKGSTSHMLAAIFQQAGYKTGLYTSPHLVDFRERIRINGLPVSKDFVTAFVADHNRLIEEVAPSFFEITVAMAFEAFAREQVDIAIIETGLGGRLDSTNVINPELSIITNISLDHTDMLGDTIAAIAGEKAGIIKSNTPVVIGENIPEALPVFESVAVQQYSPVYYAFCEWNVEAAESGYVAHSNKTHEALQLFTDLKGSFQQRNIATVLTAVDVLSERGWKINKHSAAVAIGAVKTLTGLRGRWDVWQNAPFIVADVAHNPAGLSVVMADWYTLPAKKKHIVVGFVRDKDVKAALTLFPKDSQYHFCAAAIPRALPAEELYTIATGLGLKGRVYSSVSEAVQSATQQLSVDDALLVTGSFFVVGEAMSYWESRTA